MSVQTGAAIIFDSAVQRRALLVCVGVSVVVHGLVLFALPGFQAGAPASRSRILTATLAADAALPGKEVSIEPPARPDRPRERPRRVLMPETAPRALEAPAAPAVPPPSAPASAYAAGASTSSAIDAPGRSAIPGAQAPAATAGSSGEASAADEASLERYRLGLIDAARRYRRYPVLAMEKGWQGRVEIRLVVGTNGMVKSASVKTSSSYPILDDQALDMVKKGIEFAQIPPLLRGREFTVDVPVIFELRTG